VENHAPNSGSLRDVVTEICHRLALVAMVMKIWDSTSNNEIIVLSTAKGFDRRGVRQNIVYLVYSTFTR